jgi:hypothetical protein
MVFTGLMPGTYELELRGARYKTIVLTVTVPEAGYKTRVVGLVPKTGLCAGTRAKAGGVEYFIPDGAMSLRLAQENSAAGDVKVRVHATGMADMPATFIFGKGRSAEMCTALYMRGGELTFSAPLTKPHARGDTLRLCWEASEVYNG